MNDSIKKEESLLQDLTRRLDQLRLDYEQYFIGLEKREPYQLRQEIKRLFMGQPVLEKSNRATTRFRWTTLLNKYRTYVRYWDRITRQIEEGTYSRDRKRAERRATGQGIETDPVKRNARRRASRKQAAEDNGTPKELSDVGKAAEDLIGQMFGKKSAPSAPAVDSAKPPPPPAQEMAEPPAPPAAATVESAPTQSAEKPAKKRAIPQKLRDRLKGKRTLSSPSLPKAKPSLPAAEKTAASKRKTEKRVPPPLPGARRPAPPPPPPVARVSPPPPPLPRMAKTGPGSKGEFRDLFDDYVQAQGRVRKKSAITYEQFEAKMNKQRTVHREKYKSSQIDYKVVVKDDRVSLVAKPKK